MKHHVYLVFVLVFAVGCSAHKNTCIDLRHLESKAEKLGRKINSPHSEGREYVFADPVKVQNNDLQASTSLKPERLVATSPIEIKSIKPTHKTLKKEELEIRLKQWKSEVFNAQKESVVTDTIINYKKGNYRRKLPKRLGVISLITGIASPIALFLFPLLWLFLFATSIVTGGVSLFLNHVNSERANKHALWGIFISVFSLIVLIGLAILTIARL